MDNETIDKKGGKVKEFSIHVSRKVTDGNYGSFEVSIGETVSVGSEEDFLALERECFRRVKENVLKAAVLEEKPELRNTEKPTTIKDAPPEDDYVPPPPEDGYKLVTPEEFVEAVNIPIDDKGQEKIVFPVETIEIYALPSGDKATKVRGKVVNAGKNITYGGNYTKYGVQAWKEALALPPLEWDIETMDIATYPAPPGLFAICLTKENEKGELIPTKVEEWK